MKFGKWERKVLEFLYEKGGFVSPEEWHAFYYKELPSHRSVIIKNLLKKKVIGYRTENHLISEWYIAPCAFVYIMMQSLKNKINFKT